MKIGIVRETKKPPDRRVPFSPAQCSKFISNYPGLEVVVQPSETRCFSDREYLEAGVVLQEDLTDCDFLFGVKEVDVSTLIPGKTYLFFSHTAKEQPYNRKLLKEICNAGITLIDYEYLTRKDKSRVVAFGKWAGIVGGYNGLRAYGLRTGRYQLLPAWQLSGLDEMKRRINHLDIGTVQIALTGGGRVANGAIEILRAAGIREISPLDYLAGRSSGAVFCRLDPWHYTRHIHNNEFDFSHFVNHPEEYENAFLPYAQRTDLYFACHFWDPDAPLLLSREDLQSDLIPLKVIADISCDIDGPIASTIRASTIADPFYGYNPITGMEADNPFAEEVITVMAVDNLPGELPREASSDFGNALMTNVVPLLLEQDDEEIIERARITSNGKLTDAFDYLEDYIS